MFNLSFWAKERERNRKEKKYLHRRRQVDSPDKRRLEVEKSVKLPINVVWLFALQLCLLLLLFLLLQEQLLLLLAFEQLLELQTSAAGFVIIVGLDEFQLRALVTPPEVSGC